jgi:cytochrome c-type protein NapB
MIVKRSWIGLVTLTAIITVGCASGAGTVTEESLGLRKTNLYTEASTTGDETKYGKLEAGKSQKIERAFENAPPMIPHDTEGMLPITIANNSCTGCHSPEVAADMKATPIPASHFASFRPKTGIGADGRITKEGKGVDNTSDFLTIAHKLDKLSASRFNCTQCHAPQSTGDLVVGNTFKPDFSKDGAKKSNLIDTINEGIDETKVKKVVAVTTVASAKMVTEESLGLRKTDLYTEADTTGDETKYGKLEAGKSQKFERAFENAPPMIPHDTEGMLPITITNNSCTGCHSPEVAADMKATPIPASHFASFRPKTGISANGKITKEGDEVDNTSDFKTIVRKLAQLSASRFNCTQCHAPQSTGDLVVGNTFSPDFSENGAKKSNLIDTINEGVK